VALATFTIGPVLPKKGFRPTSRSLPRKTRLPGKTSKLPKATTVESVIVDSSNFEIRGAKVAPSPFSPI
jgi:hypothetical protein